jgi:MFS family permease
MLFVSVILGMSLSIISLGQEGGAFQVLQITPLEPRSITRAKILHAFIPSSLLMSVIFYSIFSLIGDPVITAGAFLLGVTGVFDVVLVSMIIGAHYVDFTEVPRHRFVRWEGTLIAFLALFALTGVILSPFIVGLLKPEFALNPQVAFVISEVIATAVAYLGYRRAVEEVSLVYNSENL